MSWQRLNLYSSNIIRYNNPLKNLNKNISNKCHNHSKSNLKGLEVFVSDYEYLMEYKLRKRNENKKTYDITDEEKFYHQNFGIKNFYNIRWPFEW
tara:strand:- start:297 stop:581 length:285 start_codon:yes stop_codon:yes gene_type:complete